MEHLFMQIFDRKAWIEGQLKHQIRSYVESLAYNLLADGKQPPPWLCAEGPDGFGVADLKALRKEHLASGILNPLPWSTTPSANNSVYFILPTFKADKVTQVNKLTETYASNKYNCEEYSDKALPNSSQLYPYGKAVAEVVEACAEHDSPARIHHSEHRQRDMDDLFCEKEKSLNSLGEKRSEEEHNCRLTRSRVSSVKVDSAKESLPTSAALNFHNVDVGRVTRSRMVSHRDSIDKLPEPSEALNCVKGVVFKATESETAFKSIPSVKLDNIACNDDDNLVVSCTYFPGTAACPAHSCLEMPSVADSMLPNTSLLVEPKKLLFYCTEDCGLIKNLENPCEMGSSGTSVMSHSELDAVQSTKGDLPCVDLEKMDGSDGDNSQAKITERNKLLNGVSEVADASECHSNTSSGRKSADWDVCSTSSLDALANHAVEGQCFLQIKGLPNCGSACSPLETNTLIEPNHLECHNINDSGSKSSSVPALETETKSSPSIMAFIDVRSSSMELSSNSNHEVPDFGQAVPSGFLEHMNIGCTLQFSDADINHFGESADGKFAGCGNRGLHIDDNFPGRQFSHSLPSSTVSNDLEVRKPPLTPQVIKFSHKEVSGMSSGSSGKVGSNPELVCFRIDENSIIANESEHGDGSESSEENIVSKGNKNSAKRKALVDVTQNYQNAPKMVSDSKKLLNRESLESVNSESYVGTQMSSHLSLGSGYASKIEDKENVDHSVNKNRGRKAALSLRNRSSKSGKIIRSQSTSERGCKLNNIISNVTSFIPLVRQKQKAAEPLKGKKEIKVKALEAAEAAKRLEEKKQNEREMRKVAAKLERGRLEQENGRQAELKQKQKEDEKRKKEADIAARKRQREEEGKQEKERKRRCIEEARKQQKEQEEKSRALKVEKELQRKASEEKERNKELEVEAKKQLKSEKTGRVAGRQEGTNVQIKAMKRIAVPTTCASNILQVPDHSNRSNDIEKVTDNVVGLQEAKIYISEANQDMQSYQMTPYRDSDDEGGNEEIMREGKYVPFWARSECLEQIILSKQHFDPTKIFTRKCSFNLNEVLSTRITRRPI